MIKSGHGLSQHRHKDSASQRGTGHHPAGTGSQIRLHTGSPIQLRAGQETTLSCQFGTNRQCLGKTSELFYRTSRRCRRYPRLGPVSSPLECNELNNLSAHATKSASAVLFILSTLGHLNSLLTGQFSSYAKSPWTLPKLLSPKLEGPFCRRAWDPKRSARRNPLPRSRQS